jgi:hypothetical protein
MPHPRPGRSARVTAAFGVLGVCLWACAAPQAAPTSTPSPGPSATSVFPSRTPTASATSTFSPPPPTSTFTPTVTESLFRASIYGVARLSRHRLQISIKVPSAESNPAILDRGYTAVVGPSTLTCEVLPQYPYRLYCSGPDPYTNYRPIGAELTLYASGRPNPVFAAVFTIPSLPTLTPTPSKTPKPSATP